MFREGDVRQEGEGGGETCQQELPRREAHPRGGRHCEFVCCLISLRDSQHS